MAGVDAVTGALTWLMHGTRKMFYLVSPWELALDDTDARPSHFLAYGVPMFFVLIAVERIVIASRRSTPEGKAVTQPMRLNDSISCAVLGTFQVLFQLLCSILGLALDAWAYRWVWDNARFTTVDVKANVLFTYVCCLLGKDFGYYWMHRTLHTSHLMWTAHSVHHSGEDYNLPTALRQGALQPLFGFVFYLPMALLGFPPHAFEAHSQLNTMYMFAIHTDVINRLPFGMEYWLNSPMAHRLHHRPPGNCNYAGFLIIWDRMFGTYAAETTRRDYFGLAKQPQTFDALRLNVNHFKRMADIGTTDSAGKASWLYRLTAVRARHPFTFNPMALFDPIPALRKDIRGQGPYRKKWDGARPMNLLTSLYMLLVACAGLGGGVLLLLGAGSMHPIDALAATIIGGMVLVCVGRICDQHPTESMVALAASMVLAPGMHYVLSQQPARALGW